MKIVVLAKHVPDTEAVVKLTADKKAIDTTNFKYTINPCDEYAIEEALRTQEKFQGESVIISMGPERVQETIRRGLAMGIDRGLWINTQSTDTCFDSYTVALALSRALVEEKPDLVLVGLNSTDDGSGHVGLMVAELLRIPSLLNVSKIDWKKEGSALRAERDVEGGIVEVYETATPVLIAPHQNLNVPRYASLPGIMKAKRKPLLEKKVEELVTESIQLEVQGYRMPPEKEAGKIFKGKPVEEMVAEVVRRLRSEAKAI